MSTKGNYQSPTLLAVAHGTANEAGLSANRSLLELVRALRPATNVQICWLDVAQPSFEAVLPDLVGPVVVVPVLLCTGYHVKVDIPAVIGERPDTVLASHLGPDRRLCQVAALRLQTAGFDPAQSQQVRLVGSGSSDPAARDELAQAADMLGELLGQPVTYAQLTDPDPLVEMSPGCAVANYLLAPGYFDRRLHGLTDAGVVAEPLGAHPLIAEIIVDRYDQALATLRTQGSFPLIQRLGSGPSQRLEV